MTKNKEETSRLGKIALKKTTGLGKSQGKPLVTETPLEIDFFGNKKTKMTGQSKEENTRRVASTMRDSFYSPRSTSTNYLKMLQAHQIDQKIRPFVFASQKERQINQKELRSKTAERPKETPKKPMTSSNETHKTPATKTNEALLKTVPSPILKTTRKSKASEFC